MLPRRFPSWMDAKAVRAALLALRPMNPGAGSNAVKAAKDVAGSGRQAQRKGGTLIAGLQGTAALLAGTVQELRLAHKDLGWAFDGLMMRLALLLYLRNKTVGPAHLKDLSLDGLKERELEVPDEEARQWERALRWAHASYAVSSPQQLQRRVGEPPDQIQVLLRSRATPVIPAHVLAADHRHKQVVLSVRGTLGLRDLASCAHFGPTQFLSGYAHRGFVQSAEALFEDVQAPLREAQQAYPGYSLMLTGHSLGAGIAALTAMLLKERGAWEGALAAVCFATPSCVSLSLARACEGYVTTLVHADDWVPRLSALALNRLEQDTRAREWHRQKLRLVLLSPVSSRSTKRDIKEASSPATASKLKKLMHQAVQQLQWATKFDSGPEAQSAEAAPITQNVSLQQAPSGATLLGQRQPSPAAQVMKLLPESISTLDREHAMAAGSPYLLPLYPAGRALLLPSPLEQGPSSAPVSMPHDHFLTMRLSPTMFGDHRIRYYMRAVRGLVSGKDDKAQQ
eukprot:TRINITY_DN763_c0_g1_i5.p1 TRINITY_DN763_c0_g1~~TRINITY_DN763_c0_g1_i5.p1  ORF type:complete len:511 (-),score=123.12 TRINITY_DN763_c0_g1_i5:172-1704(-)